MKIMKIPKILYTLYRKILFEETKLDITDFGNTVGASVIGTRTAQEDRCYANILAAQDERIAVLAVCDGHGGNMVADEARKFIEQKIPELFLPRTHDPVATMYHFFRELITATNKLPWSGSTITVCVVIKSLDCAVLGVMGDSPALIIDKDGNQHVGPNHNVRTNLTEREAGILRGGCYEGSYLWWRESGLQMSRALGDLHMGNVLLREPEIITVAHPRKIVLASDGIEDHHVVDMLPQGIAGLQLFADTPLPGAETLDTMLRNAKPRDNLSVIIWKHPDT